MKESYIQAIILGLLIGGAIILDDFIGPKPKKFTDGVFFLTESNITAKIR